MIHSIVLPIRQHDHQFTKEELEQGVYFDFEPGDMTRYSVYMGLLESRKLLVSVGISSGGGMYTFSHFAHPSYVSSKLRLLGEVAGNAFSTLINTQLGW